MSARHSVSVNINERRHERLVEGRRRLLVDAVAPFGVEIDRLPITAETVWRAIVAGQARVGER